MQEDRDVNGAGGAGKIRHKRPRVESDDDEDVERDSSGLRLPKHLIRNDIVPSKETHRKKRTKREGPASSRTSDDVDNLDEGWEDTPGRGSSERLTGLQAAQRAAETAVAAAGRRPAGKACRVRR